MEGSPKALAGVRVRGPLRGAQACAYLNKIISHNSVVVPCYGREAEPREKQVEEGKTIRAPGSGL